MMFMGVGDVRYDSGPLQVSQFEADIRILEQLRLLWLEGGGGGNGFESYDLPWYFAATKTSTDSFEKRGKKGYLFTFGDELPPVGKNPVKNMQQVFGAGIESTGDTSQLLTAAQEKWNVFHVVIEQGGACRGNAKGGIRTAWTKLMDTNAIFLRDVKYLSEIVTATIRISEGESIDSVIDESECPDELRYAFSTALIEN
jgi:hypothetical protein